METTSIPSHVPFTGRLTQNIFKFCGASQRTEAVIVNVKFHLESRYVFTENTRQCSTLSSF